MIFPQQFFISTVSRESAVLHHIDGVAVLQSVQSVCNHYNSSRLRGVAYCVQNGFLGCSVEGAGGFVENEDFRVAEDGAGEADALALASAETDASLADDSVVVFGQRLDEIVKRCNARGLADLIVVGLFVRYAECDVPAYRIVAQIDLLRDVADLSAPGMDIGGSYGSVVDEHSPLLGEV